MNLTLCPGNGARSALRSLLSVALSSARAPRFYHAGMVLLLDGFSMLKWSVFRREFLTFKLLRWTIFRD